MRSALFIALCAVTVSACTTPQSGRSPASVKKIANKDAAEQRAKNAFYLATLPERYRNEIDFTLASVMADVNNCKTSAFAQWMVPPSDAAAAAERDAFIAKRLSRTLNFAMMDSPDRNTYAVGNAQDMQEFLCANVALQGGNLEGKALPSRSLLVTLASSPEANAPVLGMVLSDWKDGQADVALATLLINHPKIDVYLTKEILQDIFEDKFDPTNRDAIIANLLISKIYQANRSHLTRELFQSVYGRLPYLKANSEAFRLYNILLKGALRKGDANGLRPDEILSRALGQVDPNSDYSILYEAAKNGASPAKRADALLSVLYSGAKISNAESDFLELWNQQLPDAVYEKLASYALNLPDALLRLSKGTVYQVILNTSSYAASSDDLLYEDLRLVGAEEQFDLPQREVLFAKICARDVGSSRIAEFLAERALYLVHADKSIEPQITPCLHRTAMKFIGDSQLLNDYETFVAFMHDLDLKLPLATELVSLPYLDHRYLTEYATSFYERDDKGAKDLIRKIIQHPKLTIDDLDQISIMLTNARKGNMPGRLSKEQTVLLDLILQHPLVTQAMKDLIDSAKTGKWKLLDIKE